MYHTKCEEHKESWYS